MKRLVALLLLTFASAAPAAPAELPPPYAPLRHVSGEIAIFGHGALGGRVDFVEALTRKWEEGFRRHQPGVTFRTELKGTAAAMGGLYAGTADVALMGREIWKPEVEAFREVFGYDPTGIDVLTGSYATRNRGYAISVFVHKSNPIASLSLKQLDALFSLTRRRGGAPVRTWGDLGLGGAWAKRPVHLYGLSISRGFAEYFQERVFLGGARWNPSVREFGDMPGSTGEADGGAALVKAMASDPDGIGWAGPLYASPGTRMVAISDDGSPVFPSPATVTSHAYPLTRIITAYVNKPPGRPLDPKVAEFLRYILSREGQQAVVSDGGGYLPILADAARVQSKKLED